MTRYGPLLLRFLVIPLSVFLIAIAWIVVSIWYLITVFLLGILLVPYRLLRRSSRKRRRDKLQHREVLDAIDQKNKATKDSEDNI